MRWPRAARPSAKTALAAGRNGGNRSELTNRISSFSSARRIGSPSSMDDAQRGGRAGSPIGRQRELIHDRRLPAREHPFADALAVQMAKQARIAAHGGEPAQRR